MQDESDLLVFQLLFHYPKLNNLLIPLCLYSRRNIQQLNLAIENSKNLTGKRFAQKITYKVNNELIQNNICTDFLGKYLQRNKKLSIKERNVNRKKL